MSSQKDKPQFLDKPTHIYGKACKLGGSLRSNMRRKTIIRLLTFIILFTVAFSAGIHFERYSSLIFGTTYHHSRRALCNAPPDLPLSLPAPAVPTPPFPAPENTTHRLPDRTDTFTHYRYRNHPSCNISSLSLHAPFSPLCTTRQSLLSAFTGGGRIGFNAPFMPRDCDMRWYTTSEICEILSRFERVIAVGDSMMRHVVGALNVLMRQDLGYGAVTDWNFGEEEMRDCFCEHQMDVKACSVQGVFWTGDVVKNDPGSFACGKEMGGEGRGVDVVIEMMVRWPLVGEEVERFRGLMKREKPERPYAFVLGHGLWNELDLQATVNWVEGVLGEAKARAQYLEGGLWPTLFVSPNAAGVRKEDRYIVSQGDKALQIFERSVKGEMERRGVEHLGTWNMSVQMDKHDGVHLSMKGNLVKAMGVLNWLDMIDVGEW